MRIILSILFISLCAAHAYSQMVTLPYEEQFEWQVKQIDEFMDRFNNAEQTPIRQFLQEKYAMDEVKRRDLLMTLFNLQKDWDTTQVKQFLRDVTEAAKTPQLDFFDHDWYAELSCSGRYGNSYRNFTLILTVKANPKTGASRWVINSVAADFLSNTDTTAAHFPLKGKHAAPGTHTLNPASFGTDFMGLVKAMEDKANFRNYINLEVADGPVLAFFNLLYQDTLQFRQVDHITYHFLQVPGWVFRVENFSRQSSNSGWLINELIPVPEDKKVSYKKENLFLTQH